MEKYKVVIIGSGIAGMTAGIYLKRSGIEPLIIEKSAPGGTLNEIPIIENYPGYKDISGPDLAMNIYNQVNSLKIKMLSKKVNSIDLDKCIINDNTQYDYLIIATGRKRRLLNIEGEDELIGKGLSVCALCDGFFYKNKRVIVVGGSSSALTEALYLSNIAKEVIIVYRGNDLRGEKYLKDKVLVRDNIKILYNSNITRYNKDNNKLVSVLINDKDIVLADAVFLAIGSSPNSDIFDVEKENDYIIVDKNNKTSKDNVYAVGDVIKKDYYQLSTATNDAVVAALNIINRINND